ncbi:MAG: hypothetical protein A3K10_00415 [Bacteroidetes bacterium RIFCSPLOWO2_12_FULL_31_6]|nr:MAG: hypothetical protein A3K10_00415 [Bacteroidetes bacterium RIFCSPLOWO2_12_FULL_31_6]
MRIEAQIPHPNFRIVVYSIDNKYLIQIEAGSMMQAFKIDKNKVTGIEGIKQLLSTTFLSKTHDRFNDMFLDIESFNTPSKCESVQEF